MGKRKKVEKLFVEAVQVRHELWSDNEDDELTNMKSSGGYDPKRLKMDDFNGNYVFNVTNHFGIELLPTPPGHVNDEDSEDESAAPPLDKLVLYGEC